MGDGCGFVEGDTGEPVGDRAADVVEVSSLAAHHEAERDDRVQPARQRLGDDGQSDSSDEAQLDPAADVPIEGIRGEYWSIVTSWRGFDRRQSRDRRTHHIARNLLMRSGGVEAHDAAMVRIRVACATLAVALMSTAVPATVAVGAAGLPIAPGGVTCPGVTGVPGAVAVLNLTPVEASGTGFGAVRASDAPSNNTLGPDSVSNVNFRAGSVDPNVALAVIGPDGRVCFDNSPHASVHLVADQMGTLPATAYERASVSGARRMLDTRAAEPIAPGASVCAVAVGAPGRFAVVNVTPVEATATGFGAVRASDAPSNNTLGAAAVSNVNFSVGSVDPNLAVTRIGGDGRICFDNPPPASVHAILDQMGSLPAEAFVPAAASGAVRLLDTRLVGPVPAGGSACVAAVGQPGDVALVNGTPVDASGPGYLAIRASDAPSNNSLAQPVSNWNVTAGSVDPNVALATIGPDGRVCVDNSPLGAVHMILDQAGSLPAGTFTPATASGATRVVDTRIGLLADPPTGPGTAVTPPSAPLALTATAGPGRITLNWNPPAADGGAPIVGYHIQRSVNNTSFWVDHATVTARSFAESHLTPTDVYFYRVQAGNAAGWGPWSELAAEQPDPPTAPGPVTGLHGIPGDGRATLQWTAPADDGGAPITQYAVRRHADAYCQAGVTQTIVAAASTLEATFAGLTNATDYCFTVAASTVAGTTASPAVKVTPGLPTTPAPCSAVAYWYPVQGGGAEWSVDFSWTAPAQDGGFPITGYRVVWHDETSDAVQVADLPPDARYDSWNNATAGHVMTVYVNARNANGGSPVPCLVGQLAVG